jgi:hypothetical protein
MAPVPVPDVGYQPTLGHALRRAAALYASGKPDKLALRARLAGTGTQPGAAGRVESSPGGVHG